MADLIAAVAGCDQVDELLDIVSAAGGDRDMADIGLLEEPVAQPHERLLASALLGCFGHLAGGDVDDGLDRQQ